MFSKEFLILSGIFFFSHLPPPFPFELKVFHHLSQVHLVNKCDQGQERPDDVKLKFTARVICAWGHGGDVPACLKTRERGKNDIMWDLRRGLLQGVLG